MPGSNVRFSDQDPLINASLAQLHPPQLKLAGQSSSSDQVGQKGSSEDAAFEEFETSLSFGLKSLPKPDQSQLTETSDHLKKQRKSIDHFAEARL